MLGLIVSFKKFIIRNSLVVQWLGLCASTAGGMGSILGQGTKILQAVGCSKVSKVHGNLFKIKFIIILYFCFP